MLRAFSCGLFLAASLEAHAGLAPDARYVGAVGCKSSSCHGGVGEKNGQYLTWVREDFHARAFAPLTNARSARIAETLGLANPAESPRCTICHSPLAAAAPARLRKSADPREGVSCESCHGAAGHWWRGHTRTDWTYATRVGAGMRDLRSVYVRANTCVACHQNLDSEIAAAGHPELCFELDRQSTEEPKHWRDPEGSGPRLWLTGQAVALRELSWRLTSAADGPTEAQAAALRWLLAEVTAADPALPRIDPAAPPAQAQQQADSLARAAAAARLPNVAAIRQRLLRLAPADFRQAERLVLALEALGGASPELRAALRAREAFEPAAFAEHLRKLAP